MSKHLIAKTLGIIFLLVISVIIFHAHDAKAASDSISGTDYCIRHGFHAKKTCSFGNKYFPRSDYSSADLSYNIAGHRHGSSEIRATICLYSTTVVAQGTGCTTFQCTGDACGAEYGGQHPYNTYKSGSINASSVNGNTGYRVYRSAYVEDSEVRISWNASATYTEPTPTPSPPPPVSVSISANPTSGTAPLGTTISWSSQNATNCTTSGGVSGWPSSNKSLSGSQGFSLNSSATFSISCSNSGSSDSDSVTVNVTQSPSGSISASPNPINVCPPDTTGSTTLTVTNVNVFYEILVDLSPRKVFTSGSPTSYRTHTTPDWVSNGLVFYLVESGTSNILDSVTVTHTQSFCPTPAQVDLKANGSNGPITIPYNTSATLSWTTQNAAFCLASGDWSGTKSASGGSQSTGNLTSSKTYSISCSNFYGGESDSVTVNVQPPATPTAVIRANGQDNNLTIPYNSSATISWTCTNSNSGSVSPTGWSGTTGSRSTGSLTSSVTYTLTCTGSTGTAIDDVTVTVQSPTLSVNLSANPSSGNPPLNTILQATTGGTATGTVNYYFWWNCNVGTSNVSSAEQSCGVLPAPPPGSCTSNANGYRCNAVSSFSTSVGHTYTSSGTAKVIVQRGAASPAEDRVGVTVTNSLPIVTFVNVTQPNYCSSGPAATVNWGYSDPEGTAQTAYQVQIDDNPAFNSPNVDSGQVFSSGTSFFGGLGALQYNTTYRARVRVWDGAGLASNWVTSSPWNTPQHSYPIVNFNFTPPNPATNQDVQFTDQTTFFDGQPDSGHSWLWRFQAPLPSPSSTAKNPTYQYPAPNSYNVQLTSTDAQGFQCSLSKPINVQEPIPIFKEVAP